jgi:hypothetical protein
MVQAFNFKKAVCSWEKLTLNYAISILEQNVDNFRGHDYSIYKNSRINIEELELSIYVSVFLICFIWTILYKEAGRSIM